MKRKTPLKRTPIKTRKNYWKSKADRLWQKLMHELWGHRCAMCGAPIRKINADPYDTGKKGAGHHLIKRAILHLRYHLKCGMLLCDYCHNCAPKAPHKSSELFDAFLEKEYPDLYIWVQEHKNEYGTKPDYQETCKDLEKMLEEARKTGQ